jgi:autotransporter passenger strand-loop-strand repeat protein
MLIVNPGNTLVVASGQTSSGIVVMSGGIAIVESGGTAIDASVSGGMLAGP